MINKILSHGGCASFLFSDSMSGAFPCNPTCVVYNNKLIVNVRALNYFFPLRDKFGNIQFAESYNWIGYMRDNLIGANLHELPSDIDSLHSIKSLFNGREDIRLIVWNERLYGYASRPDKISGHIVEEILQFDDHMNIESSFLVLTDRVIEKNWIAISDRPLQFLYDIDTNHIIEVNNDGTYKTVHRENSKNIHLSGSSTLIPYRDYYICIAHEHFNYPVYNNYILIYDKDLRLIEVSDSFKLSNCPIEFITGMCIYNNQVVITYSVYDSVPIILTIPLDTFDWILGIGSEPERSIVMRWEPQYISDPYQNLALQMYHDNRSGFDRCAEELQIL